MTQQVRVLTKDGSPSGATVVRGTKVFIGGTEVKCITGLELEADIGGIWSIKLTIPVDPATLFGRLSDEAPDVVTACELGAMSSKSYTQGR